MKQGLQISLSQHLALTPQLQLSIRFLQMSTLELSQELNRYLSENPLLEKDDGENETQQENTNETTQNHTAQSDEPNNTNLETDTLNDAISDTPDTSNYDNSWENGNSTGAQHTTRDHFDNGEEMPEIAASYSLQDHLDEQLNMSHFSDRDKQLIQLLISTLDENGYLATPLDELLESLPNIDDDPELEQLSDTTSAQYETGAFDICQDDLQTALYQLQQNFDPVGIGARNLQECLRLQLEPLPDSAHRTLALQIIERHIELLGEHNFAKIKRFTKCDDGTLQAAQTLIAGLDPKPGTRFAQLDTRYVVPDVLIKKQNGHWQAIINPDIYPRLRVNGTYAKIWNLQKNSSKNGLNAQLQEARWLIKSIQQRFTTILRVAQAIVERQQAFFELGEIAMQPMILQDIASELELHKSTVSRVTSQKYMATARGTFELKYFFNSHVGTKSGGECSSTAIRAFIKQIVEQENRKKPLSDNQISEILGQQSIVVARRTVAKYREALGIASTSQRKALS